MNANSLQRLIQDAIWLAVSAAATFGLWAWAANARPAAAQKTDHPADEAAPTPIQGSGVLEGSQGQSSVPSVSTPETSIDNATFPTPSAEEIATREAYLMEHTYLSPGVEPPPPGQSQSLFQKAPLQTSLAGTGSIAVVVLLARFLHTLALLWLGK